MINKNIFTVLAMASALVQGAPIGQPNFTETRSVASTTVAPNFTETWSDAPTTTTVTPTAQVSPYQSATPAEVPLYVYQIAPGEYKIGINLSLGGSNKPLPYEFDTGSSGLQSGFNKVMWPEYTPSGEQTKITYFSGNQYLSNVVSTQVNFYDANGNVAATIPNADVGQIFSATNTKNASKLAHWDSDMAEMKPPLFGQFFGDFGIGLNCTQGKLFPLLPQLPGMSEGFIIKLANFKPDPSNPTIGIVGQGSLQLGLFDTDAQTYGFQVPMNKNPGNTQLPFPNPAHNQFVPHTWNDILINGTMTLTPPLTSRSNKHGSKPAPNPNPAPVSFETGYLLDTGAPTTTIHDIGGQFNIPRDMRNAKDRRFVKGIQATWGVGNDSDFIEFTTGSQSSVNEISYTTQTVQKASAYINTGLQVFFNYNVMFNLQTGVVGFASLDN